MHHTDRYAALNVALFAALGGETLAQDPQRESAGNACSQTSTHDGNLEGVDA
jgi:hypothetical protein